MQMLTKLEDRLVGLSVLLIIAWLVILGTLL
jgi:hypothetical protein